MKIKTPNKEIVEKKEYKARIGARFNDEEAQIYGERIQTLMERRNGKVTTLDVLNDAEHKSSPLHDYFQWNDDIAANEHRLQQARHLIASIVEVVVIEEQKTDQRSFMSVSNDEVEEPTRVFVSLTSALTNKNLNKEIMGKIINHLENTTKLLKLFREHEGE